MTLVVIRPTPPLLIVTNATPQGGAVKLFCGQGLDGLQAKSSATGFSNYTFTSTGVVSVSGGQNTGVPTSSISGPGTGTIDLKALYTRNGASTYVAAPTVSVTVSNTVAPVTMQPIPNSCVGQTIRVQVDPVPGATDYTWDVPYPFSPQGSTTTTQPFLDITSSATALSRSFTVGVAAGNSSSGCTASTASRTGVVGPGTGAAIVPDASHTDTEICAYTTFQLSANIVDLRYIPNTAYTYDWTVNQRNGQTGAISTTYAMGQSIQVTSPGTGDWLDVYLQVYSSCGDFYPTSQSWQSVYQFANGEFCLVSRPNPDKAAAAYPNPADERLHLPIAASAYSLYDGYGRAVLQGQPAGVLDTRQLPNGLYYLVHQDAAGRAVRQAIQVMH
ncbi:hypothetical protein [Hymenobacter rubidus]|uniref:hypothetical protein n=1 Tax=Hymenobacter rubidus TaxID=1441626 RepID=UPI00191EAD1E|nr:hypothetical protein [Hymenobacter rubidus]